MRYEERVYWNTHSYGKGFLLTRKALVTAYITIALAIPIVFPVVLAPLVAKAFPQGIKIRWGQ